MATWSSGGRGNIRASDADRDRVAEILGAAYADGRLSKDEYDDRLAAGFSARTYADLDRLVADLPRAAPVVRPSPGPVMQGKTNSLAVASIACGLGQFLVGPLATIPAIVLGHMALHQVRRTGEQGAGLALAGLLLGWTAVILGLVAIIAMGLVAASGIPGPIQGP
jgi:uncharacterized membrane protein